MTEPQLGGTYDQLLGTARMAERMGLASFARSDHYYSSRKPPPAATDAFATMGGLARETERIRLCILVTPITFRHPAVIAKSAATIAEMSSGRLDLGLGTGWMELEHEAFGLPFPPLPERFDRLEEALRYLIAAFGPGEGSYHGRYYSLEANAYPQPGPIPIIVGGSGRRRTPRLAGTYADEFNHFVTSASDIEPKVKLARRAAEAVGRDPEALRVSVMGPVLTGRDRTAYREALRRRAADRGTDSDTYEQRLLEAGIPFGPPDRVAETMHALSAVGVSRFYVQHLDLSDLDPLEETFEVLLGL